MEKIDRTERRKKKKSRKDLQANRQSGREKKRKD